MEKNYVVIESWMTGELNLSGNELLVFALIYGFCQDGDSEFFGSRRYIAEMFNITLPTVDKALKSLITKGLLIKDSIRRNNLDFITYKVSLYPIKNEEEKNFIPYKKFLYINNKNNNTNTISINKENKTNTKVLVDKPKKQNKFSKCEDEINEFTDDVELRDLLIQYLKMRLEIRDKPMYINQWKGLLNKLNKLSVNIGEQKDIVQQSLDRGYASFYKINTRKRINNESWNINVTSQSYTDDELEKLDEQEKELNARGIRTRF